MRSLLRLESAALWVLLAALALLALTMNTGCATAGKVFRTEQVQVGTVPADSVRAADGSLVPVASLPAGQRATLDPAAVVRAGTPLTEERVAVAPAVQAVVKGVSYLPVPYADVASMGLSGALSIVAVWLNKRKRTAEKINQSLVQGVDTFRDILDQTEGGGKLDELLTRTLKERQEVAGVAQAVKSLLDRYATPPKPHASTLTAAALKS